MMLLFHATAIFLIAAARLLLMPLSAAAFFDAAILYGHDTLIRHVVAALRLRHCFAAPLIFIV